MNGNRTPGSRSCSGYLGSLCLYPPVSLYQKCKGGNLTSGIYIAGLTLTLWIPGQTLLTSTSSYSHLIQRLKLGCDSFQLMHISRDDLAVRVEQTMAARGKTKHIIAFTISSSGWVLPRMCQCTTAIMAV